jgi:uncharacterized protein
MQSSSPVASQERIASLDVLRGFALLGILVMNIQTFAMPVAAYGNPTAYGDLQGINLWVWQLGYLFFNLKFMTLFSMLFGAGVLLFIDRATARGASAGKLHYRRSGWLILFGLLHGHLLWYGDILYIYGMCALLVFLFRNRSARSLLIWALMFTSVTWGFTLFIGFSWEHIPEPDRVEMEQDWKPNQTEIEAEIADYNGGIARWLPRNSELALELETIILLFFSWRVTGMMLLGMALYRWGVLSAERDGPFYRRLLLAGALIGLALIITGMVKNHQAGYSVEYSKFVGITWNYWGSVALALAYIGLVVGAVRNGAWPALQRRLAAVGRMAFSNYILHTIIGVAIFRGLGIFGDVERWQQLTIVIAVWLLQLWLSPMWLARFRFGPLEWLWRSLTYWKMQPMGRG